MAFVAFVIGLANCMSLILTQGNILHTIVHFLTAPLMDLPRSVASVGKMCIRDRDSSSPETPEH